jgi:CBS domain-containing protein
MPQVSEVMTRGVRTMSPNDSFLLAAQAMSELNIGSLPVSDSDRLVGIVTDRDIVVRAVAQERGDARLRDTMSAEPVYCYDDESVEQALETMRGEQVRRLLVVDRNKRLVGVLAMGDVTTDGSDEEAAGQALSDISEPSEPDRSHLGRQRQRGRRSDTRPVSAMVNQTDSPDGRPRKDPNRPSPALVETDDPGDHPSPAEQPYQPTKPSPEAAEAD